MLDLLEAEQVQQIFGATAAQVRRDHAISHVLEALASIPAEVIFFGGTALARTCLSRGRLSEDIDLYSRDRRGLTSEIDRLPELIAQEFPRAFWDSRPSEVSEPRQTLLVCDPEIQIQVQVLDSRSRGWNQIPIQKVPIQQRYSDVGVTQLDVPTVDGFVALKVMAWFERASPRDLFDLEGLSRLGPVTKAARDLIAELLGFQMSWGMLNKKLAGLWSEELAHQTHLEISEAECREHVLAWWKADSGEATRRSR